VSARPSAPQKQEDDELISAELAEVAHEPVKPGRRWLWILAWVVATALLVICFRVVGVGRLLDIASRLDPKWVALSLVANFCIQLSAAMMWRLLLPEDRTVPYKRLVGIMLVGSLLMNTTPMLVGHASLALMLSRQRGVGNAAAVSVLSLDQLAEGLSKLAVVIVALAVGPVPDWMRKATLALSLVMVAMLALLFTLARRHESLANWSQSRRRVAKFIADSARHLETIRSPRRFAVAWCASLGMKVAELTGLVAAQRALDVHIPVAHSLLVLAASGLGTVLPLTPGNIGTYEAVVLLAYKWLGLDAQTALAVALVQHLSYLAASTLPGYFAVTVRQFRRRRPRPV
jgi:uncharacterized protein (TIRG00374 family)